MQDKIKQLIEECNQSASQVTDIKEVAEIKVKYLGKNGSVTGLLKSLKDYPKEERPEIGKYINEARDAITEIVSNLETVMKSKETLNKLAKESIDITMPSKKIVKGSLHPLTQVKNEIINAFMGLGFTVSEGPEVETDYYSFQALNIPKDHPARDMQDTFYISDNVILRPHTSPEQIRVMEKTQPPIRILSPGRVYRADDDATHSPMFHQIEGLVVDNSITLCDLKGILDEFARTVFSSSSKTRFRSSHFPFTEPSVEVDTTCMVCGGKGCRICKGTGWIEILGSGMVHRNVLSGCDIDPDKYSGFAFGMGIERIAMIKYGIPDIRLLYENDVRFLEQFK